MLANGNIELVFGEVNMKTLSLAPRLRMLKKELKRWGFFDTFWKKLIFYYKQKKYKSIEFMSKSED